MIISIIGLDFFRRQDDAIVQPAKHSLEQLFYYKDVNFGHFFLLNREDLTCLIDKTV